VNADFSYIHELKLSKFKVRSLRSAYCHVRWQKRLTRSAVVDGFQVGMPDALPAEGSAVDTSSYAVCGTMNVEAAAGNVVTVHCAPSTQQFRYVIVQSLDTSDDVKRLGIREVAVIPPSQYT